MGKKADCIPVGIRYRMEMRGASIELMAKACSCSVPTMYRKLRLPETMTVADLRHIAVLLGCSAGDIADGRTA